MVRKQGREKNCKFQLLSNIPVSYTHLDVYKRQPIFKPEHRDAELYKKELQKQTGLSWYLGRQVISYLKTSLEFSDKEIKNNRDLFVKAQMELPDIMTELAILRGKSRTKTNQKGWIINALKGKIKDK